MTGSRIIASLRCTAGTWATISVVACAMAKEPAPAGAVPPDTLPHRVAAMTPLAPDTVPVVATPGLDTLAPVGRRGVAPKEGGSIPSAGHAKSATGGARVTGGPERTPIPPRSSGCGGTFVVVTLKPGALAEGDETAGMRTASREVLAPVRDQVGSASLSPAIRAFRVSVRNPANASRIVRQLRASSKVQSATVDECAVRIERE